MTPGPHGTQPLVAGHRRRTSNTYGVKHRSTARGTSPRRHCLGTPRTACRTTSTVRLSLLTPVSVPSSSSLHLPYPNHAFRSSRPLPPKFQPLIHPLSNKLRKSWCGERPRNGSSPSSYATPAHRPRTPEESSQCCVSPPIRQFELSTRPGQSRINSFRSARNLLCSVQCKIH
jgi:hypothetical protein